MDQAEQSPVIAGVAIDDVGVLPQVVAQINELAERETATAEDVSEVILRDPTLTTKILRIINSSYYGLRQEIRSIRHAVAYLGINQVRNLVISSALIESFQFDHVLVEPRTVWEHSLGCAIGAKRLGDALEEVDGDGAYLGGLLHDLGRIVLLAKMPSAYADALTLSERGVYTLHDAEGARFGMTHERIGYELGRAWGFSPPVLAMIRHHHAPQDAGPYASLAAAVAYADAVCHANRLSFGFALDDQSAEEGLEQAWQTLEHHHPGADAIDRAPIEAQVVRAVLATKELVAGLF